MTVEIPLKLKYRIGGKAKKSRLPDNGNSGKKIHKGILVPVGIRKRLRVRRSRC